MIPPASDPIWVKMLSSELEIKGASLATRLFLTRLRTELKARSADPASKVSDLRGYFERSPTRRVSSMDPQARAMWIGCLLCMQPCH